MLELSPEQLRQLRAILSRRLPHREVRAFGSRVTGLSKPHSDLDLVAMGDAPIDDLSLAELRADLDDSDLPFRIDVVPWSKAPPHLREAIGRASVTIQN